jgi:hypothetical protein
MTEEKEIKGNRIEKALFTWLNKTTEFEAAVCKMVDEELHKRDLIRMSGDVKQAFRYLENLIKKY